MRLAYSLMLYILTPYLLLRLWWKGRQIPGYRERISERFTLSPIKQEEFDVWVHAVSLGEVIAVTPLIDTLLQKQLRILMTTMTPTGAERVQQRFGNKVSHQYVPYDLPDVVGRFYKKNRPKVAVFVETELWPNLGFYAHQAKIPLILVNARLSERSYQGYKKVKFLFKPLLQQFNYILAQTEDDAKRFIALGADTKTVNVFGNMKFDLQTQDINQQLFTELKAKWGNERVVMMIASTHESEEEQILSQLKKLQAAIPKLILLIAPRHPERFQKIHQLCRNMGFNTGLRSQIETLTPENEIIVLDSLGELLGWYQVSDYAFVGGSFVPVGGHNVLEPIAMKVPVFSGPHVHNFKTICQDLKNAEAIELVENAEELIARVVTLHHDKNRKDQLIKNATQVLEMNKGAVARYAERIESALNAIR
ncbi:lipid IV(A) 3-deoxy-D-manno-octulosonic acid transferase [Legionella hackeliae]|uniref:3-deoxy-D-manno-octulosonic acid transferase n=1 Tax=Legionella hackeliae TaxID=449 RepID=A0A0A8UMB3_LEGHA|nr:lipid IV(A) 3-deoxy-D-manno-octulosonic acid transferase [Legionella hackeliae]KTD10399.1 3-deoxy-D-manno-oct-2-ulosonic acid transferase [Legionella hackeliae]CEK09898.1 3-deoxy-D-manno-octulosonic-acid transferase [Legionella hackeliae]STX49810.1 3-deoxy-D-manno-oct-2-ulosonic acid transferase [Legionella hackeliae]